MVIGITTATFIVTAFVFGVASIVVVILNCVKRAEARGTFIESHVRSQIRTFWFALLWCSIGALLAIPMFIAVGLWVIYRVIRGWLALKDGKAI